MAYEMRDNTGSLFKNDRKENENHADYTGKVLIAGVEYYQNAWVKTAKSGKKYFSQSFKPVAATQSNNVFDDDLNDEIPF